MDETTKAARQEGVLVMAREAWTAAIDRMLVRVQDTARRVKDFPHWADPATGEWVTTPDGDWTGGFWVGLLWLAHSATGEEKYRRWALPFLDRLRGRINVESVFKSFPLYYGGAIGGLVAGEVRARETALLAADSLAGMYDPTLRLIPLGRQAEEGGHVGATESSIDSLHASVLLLWAGHEAGDKTLRDIGINHADRVIELHLRSDGSFIQSSSLDSRTGRLIRHYTHKGYSDSSTWGRAQTWGTLFSALSCLHGKSETWLVAAARGADWWMAHVPGDKVAFWDFDDPTIPNTERDTTATAAAAAALLRVSVLVQDESGRRKYREFAEATVGALVKRYLTPTHAGDRRVPGILTESCFNKRRDARPQDAANRCEFIVGAYYLFESLLSLAGRLDCTRL